MRQSFHDVRTEGPFKDHRKNRNYSKWLINNEAHYTAEMR